MNKQTIVLASHNAGKLKELNALFANEELALEVVSQALYEVPSVSETGLTFVENALLKARHACSITGLASIADDSGIEIDALNGAPGIYSARFAGDHASDLDNNRKLISLLKAHTNRVARYRCLLVYMRHQFDPAPIICQGCWQGLIIDSPIGEHGFGYDPHFWLADLEKTAAQLTPSEKNRLSHRGQAMQQLLAALHQEPGIGKSNPN